jgi:protein phosphatase
MEQARWYVLTYSQFMYNLTKFYIGSGIAPSPRAAHGSCSVDSLQMVVYGGATGGGSLASDDLYLLDLRNGD